LCINDGGQSYHGLKRYLCVLGLHSAHNPFPALAPQMTKILVIDDDVTFRFYLSRALSNQGYELILAENGEEGIFKARSHAPAMIICDWMMPGLDGLDVCREIKADPELLTTFFMLLTAKGAQASDRIKGLETGADDFLTKPIIDINELRARVRAGLRLHQLSQDLQLQKYRLEAELADAADYVRSLLPNPMTGLISIDSRYIPCKQLGGDGFDFYWLNPNELVFFLLDVSGHGVRSALLSTSVLSLLRSQSLKVPFNQPSAVLTALNDTFQMHQHRELYFTLWYGVYNVAQQKLTYSSAGHPPAILLNAQDKGQAQMLKTIGPPIGMLPDVQFIDQQDSIPPGSALYIFSDGIYELRLRSGELWTIDAFANVIETQCGLSPATLTHLLRHVQSTQGKISFEDDVSILHLNFPALDA
jgi:phosphoserine phosphatase RsbU/P